MDKFIPVFGVILNFGILTLGVADSTNESATTPATPSVNVVNAAKMQSADSVTQSTDKVLVIVNGKNITQTMYDHYAASRPTGSSRDSNAIIEELIKRELVLQDALKRGIDQQPNVIAELSLLRENLLVAAGLKSVVETLTLNDQELQKFYQNHLQELSVKEYKARHILVPTREEAEVIIAELDKGADFIKLATEKSKDNPSEGGDLGWFSVAQMVQPLAEAISSLEKGKYTPQPINTEFGWHILFHEDTRESPPPNFESVKEKLISGIQRLKLQEYIKNLRAQAKVEMKN